MALLVSPLRRWPFWGFFALGLGCFYWGDRLTADYSLRKAEERWLAAGESFSAVDYDRPVLPDQENFCAAPPLMVSPQAGVTVEMAAKNASRLLALTEGLQQLGAHRKRSPEIGIDYGRRLERSQELGPGSLDQKTRLSEADAARRAWSQLPQDESLIAELIQAAQRPYSRLKHPVEFLDLTNPGNPSVTSSPWHGWAFTSRAFDIRAMVALDCERFAEAFDLGLISDRIQEAMTDYPALMPPSHHVPMAWMAGLQRNVWNREQLEKISARVQPVDDTELTRRLRSYVSYETLTAGQIMQLVLFPTTEGSLPLGEMLERRASKVGLLLMGADTINHRGIARSLDFARHYYLTPMRSSGWRSMIQRPEWHMIAPWTKRNNDRLGGMMSSIDSAVETVVFSHTRRQLARLACAVRLYQMAERRPPATLHDLVPKYLPALPLDLDEQPFRYEVRPTEAILSSVGQEKDDSRAWTLALYL